MYSDTIAPIVVLDAEVRRLEAEIAKAEERLAELRRQRCNRVSEIVARACYPTAED